MLLDVFISHSSLDDKVALALIELLREACEIPKERIRCTSVAGYKLPGGSRSEEQLRQETQEAKTFIGLITPNSISSAYVTFELGARWGADRHFIPLLACGADYKYLQGPITGRHAFNCVNEEDIHQMIGEIAEQLGIIITNLAAYQKYVKRLATTSKRYVPKLEEKLNPQENSHQDFTSQDCLCLLESWLGSQLPEKIDGTAILFKKVDEEITERCIKNLTCWLA
jgi:hypothetical protein